MNPSVLHIATQQGGGAGIAASRIHRALMASDMPSRMVVKEGPLSTGGAAILPARRGSRSFRERFETRTINLERRLASKAVSRKLAYFSDDRVPGPDRLAGRADADVLHLHWVAHFLDYGKFFPTVPAGHPLVWTLADMAPLTGGCHYAMDCNRFEGSCGACPLLGSTSPSDLTFRIHRRKRAALDLLRPDTTRIVAPTPWMAKEARRSSLMRRFDVDVIPYCLDVDIFQRRDRHVARELLGVPQEHKVILFAAVSVADYRKGFDLLQEAFRGMKDDEQVTLLALGASGGERREGMLPLGRIDNERILSHVYSAADLFVLPTRAEAVGQVLSEAMACGVPCVTFDGGGAADVVRHEETGLVASMESAEGLRTAIERLLGDQELGRRFGARGRSVAEAEFSDRIVAERYTALYEELIAARSRRRAAAE